MTILAAIVTSAALCIYVLAAALAHAHLRDAAWYAAVRTFLNHGYAHVFSGVAARLLDVNATKNAALSLLDPERGGRLVGGLLALAAGTSAMTALTRLAFPYATRSMNCARVLSPGGLATSIVVASAGAALVATSIVVASAGAALVACTLVCALVAVSNRSVHLLFAPGMYGWQTLWLTLAALGVTALAFGTYAAVFGTLARPGPRPRRFMEAVVDGVGCVATVAALLMAFACAWPREFTFPDAGK